MSAPVYLGPRASFLLGLLCSPMSVRELYDLVGRSLDMDPDLVETIEGIADALSGVQGGSPFVTIRSLHDGGTAEIRRHLVRLERMGLVTRASLGSNETQLWWRT